MGCTFQTRCCRKFITEMPLNYLSWRSRGT
jgi:hypothetical protein